MELFVPVQQKASSFLDACKAHLISNYDGIKNHGFKSGSISDPCSLNCLIRNNILNMDPDLGLHEPLILKKKGTEEPSQKKFKRKTQKTEDCSLRTFHCVGIIELIYLEHNLQWAGVLDDRHRCENGRRRHSPSLQGT